MNKNEKFVITINREVGSGGRTVGEKLAAKLGVPFYDKALIKALQKKYNLTVAEIERLKGAKNNWWSDFSNMLSLGDTVKYYKVEEGQEPEVLTTEDLFQAEQEILQGIANNGSCVIAGRSGFYVFRKHPNHLSVLIHASQEARVQRIMRKNNVSEKEAEKIIETVDTMRENYVNRYTGMSRYDTKMYDLVISMDGLSEDDAASLIFDYIQKTSK